MKASKIPSEEKVKFAYATNIRRIIIPKLPFGYWGNGCVPMYVQFLAQELVNQPLSKTADSIKKSKFNTTDEYVRSFIDFQELHYHEGIKAGNFLSTELIVLFRYLLKGEFTLLVPLILIKLYFSPCSI